MKSFQLIVLSVFLLALSSGCARKICTVKTGLCKGYTVRGQTYHPMKKVPPGFRMDGVASWYGHKFHGRPTASGEIYDMHDLTAAHKTLPLGTLVKVTNMENRKEVIVRINDRGPFIDNRVIDLSLAAAKRIAMIGPGTASVRISVLGKSDSLLALKRPSPWAATAYVRAPNPFYTSRKTPSAPMKKI
jgi:rare lipoprotein A